MPSNVTALLWFRPILMAGFPPLQIQQHQATPHPFVVLSSMCHNHPIVLLHEELVGRVFMNPNFHQDEESFERWRGVLDICLLWMSN
jgi:hypothetical protein